MEVVFLIECEIPSLKLVVELLLDTSTKEEHLLYLAQLDKQHYATNVAIEAHKR